MSGFENDVMYAKNADFTQVDNQNASESNGLATNGQLWIGATSTNAGGTHINVGAITSGDSSITVSYSSPNITLAVAGGTSVLKTLTGNSGGALSPTAGNINITGTGSLTVSGSGSTLTPQLTGLTNHALQVGAGTATLTQIATGSSGQILRSGGAAADPAWSTSTYPATNAVSTLLYASSANVMAALATANSAILNTNGSGVPSLATSPSVSGTITAGTGLTATTGAITATSGNVVITSGNLTLAATSSSSIGSIKLGGNPFMHAFGDPSNVWLGTSAGNYTNTSNGNVGIGNSAMAGITSGNTNVGIGNSALTSMQTGGNNVAIGSSAMQNPTSGSSNVAIGVAACGSNSGFTQCVGVGQQALQGVTGNNNVGIGYAAGISIGSGTQNTAIGTLALNQAVTGNGNIALGYASGTNYTLANSNNICIGNAGNTGTSGEIQIGTNGTHTKCTVQGISGVTVTGSAVLCSTAGLLGTVVSSARYKENIVDMPESMSILHLRPIQFTYKATSALQYGLLAEDVDRDFPYLCLYNDEDKPESVKYHELCTFLLNEVKKLDKRVRELEKN